MTSGLSKYDDSDHSFRAKRVFMFLRGFFCAKLGLGPEQGVALSMSCALSKMLQLTALKEEGNHEELAHTYLTWYVVFHRGLYLFRPCLDKFFKNTYKKIRG